MLQCCCGVLKSVAKPQGSIAKVQGKISSAMKAPVSIWYVRACVCVFVCAWVRACACVWERERYCVVVFLPFVAVCCEGSGLNRKGKRNEFRCHDGACVHPVRGSVLQCCYSF